MADALLVLNPGVGGDNEDVESLIAAAGQPAIRQRLQVTGAILAEVARVKATLATLADMGLVVRLAGNRSETTTTTAVPGALVLTPLIGANVATRIGLSIYNDAHAGVLSIFLGANVNPTLKIAPGGYWEAPFGTTDSVSGLWSAAPPGTQALITEYT